MKKAVVVVMKERHRVFPGTLFLGINDELTPGQQTAVVWRWSQRGGICPLCTRATLALSE